MPQNREPQNRLITVSEENGNHVCVPTHTHVKSLDTVSWQSAGSIEVTFVGDTPFKDGLGPFLNNGRQTVREKPHLEKGESQTFQPVIRLNGKLLKTIGDIIFEGG
jgi:hypothetical protein